jgi:hypothetical protein
MSKIARLAVVGVLCASALCVPNANAASLVELGEVQNFDLLRPLPAIEKQQPRFIMGDIHGFVRVFEHRGIGFEEIWVSEYLEGAIAGLELIDMDNDSREEIVIYTNTGRIHYLDITSYTITWSNPPSEYERITALTVEDIDDDPQPELIFCADGRLIIYDGRDQFEEWRSDQDNITATELLIADVDGDEEREIVLNDGFIFDASFHDLEWQSPLRFGDKMGILDVDNDGIVELIGEYNGRFIRIFDVDLRREKSLKR